MHLSGRLVAIKLLHTNIGSTKEREQFEQEAQFLSLLEYYEEALVVYEQAISLDPILSYAYSNKGYALQQLGRGTEAQQVYEKARQLG